MMVKVKVAKPASSGKVRIQFTQDGKVHFRGDASTRVIGKDTIIVALVTKAGLTPEAANAVYAALFGVPDGLLAAELRKHSRVTIEDVGVLTDEAVFTDGDLPAGLVLPSGSKKGTPSFGPLAIRDSDQIAKNKDDQIPKNKKVAKIATVEVKAPKGRQGGRRGGGIL
ncbi:MAG: hypothetical protein AB1625_12800 [Acidobacteriota bacterium]